MERIDVNPHIMGGKPVIKGTRVTVERVLELISLGYPIEDVAKELDISTEDVKAALDFARKWMAEEVLETAQTSD